MKIRNDFVTNSSSSSYIIAYKSDENSLCSKIMEHIAYSVDYFETSVGDVLRSRAEFEDYFANRFDYKTDRCGGVSGAFDDSYGKGTYSHIAKMLDEGFNVCVKSVGYSDDLVKDLIDLMADEGMITYWRY